MRPDTRSFSFTWLKGQQHLNELNLGRARTRNQSQRRIGIGSIRLEETSSPQDSQENTMPIQQRCSIGQLRSFRASRIWNPKKYVAIDENDVQGEQEQKTEATETAANEPQSDDQSNGPKSTTTTSLGRRLNRTMQEVKNSIGSLSQIIRRSTRRHYRMAAPLATEISPTRQILGRTPTKLYSPFGFDSPLQSTPMRLTRSSTPRLTRRNLTPTGVYSPTNNFRHDVKEARRGLRELHVLSRDITRRSVRF